MLELLACEYIETRADHGDYRTGRLLPCRVTARQRLRGVRRRPALERAECLAHSAPADAHHAAAGRPARSAVADQGGRAFAAAGVLQPGRDVVRARVVGPADA